MQYHVHIKGHLDPSWQDWLAGLQINYEAAGTTVLSGSLPDQAALYGVLLKIDRLGLTLLALETHATEKPRPSDQQCERGGNES